MPLTFPSVLRSGTTAAFLLAAAVIDARAGITCGDRGTCLDAVMAAARAGHEAQEYALMNEMRRKHRTGAPGVVPGVALPPRLADEVDVGNVDLALIRLVRNVDEALAHLPEYHHALALTYLQTGRLDEARRLLEDALEGDPARAPYWLDLAIVHARQGDHERAVSALVVAYAWTGDQAALRQAYQQAAATTPEAGMKQDYAAALQVIEANAAEAAREDDSLPPAPPKGAPPDPSRKPATVDFSTCAYPEYPKPSLRYEETGTVTLSFLVAADGSVKRIRKTKSSGHSQLDNAAALALTNCRFKPATLDGKPIATWQPVQYVWTLE
jgi:TonB family protein